MTSLVSYCVSIARESKPTGINLRTRNDSALLFLDSCRCYTKTLWWKPTFLITNGLMPQQVARIGSHGCFDGSRLSIYPREKRPSYMIRLGFEYCGALAIPARPGAIT